MLGYILVTVGAMGFGIGVKWYRRVNRWLDSNHGNIHFFQYDARVLPSEAVMLGGFITFFVGLFLL